MTLLRNIESFNVVFTKVDSACGANTINQTTPMMRTVGISPAVTTLTGDSICNTGREWDNTRIYDGTVDATNTKQHSRNKNLPTAAQLQKPPLPRLIKMTDDDANLRRSHTTVPEGHDMEVKDLKIQVTAIQRILTPCIPPANPAYMHVIRNNENKPDVGTMYGGCG